MPRPTLPASALRWALLAALLVPAAAAQPASEADTHADLAALFAEWRAFEAPPLLDGAPDYTEETFLARADGFAALRDRLHGLDTTGWSVPEQVDWHLVRAEMNGYDFNVRVLRPWARDPAFYKTV
ncbi:MAG: hypothetical protein AAFN13_11685, partial [Bacteroidota bacterium]